MISINSNNFIIVWLVFVCYCTGVLDNGMMWHGVPHQIIRKAARAITILIYCLLGLVRAPLHKNIKHDVKNIGTLNFAQSNRPCIN